MGLSYMWHIPEPRNMELWYSHIKLQTREQQKQDNHRSHYRFDIRDTKMATWYIQL